MRLLLPGYTAEMPSVREVRDLYFAASSRPPLNETKETAALFASVYEVSLQYEAITAVVSYDGDTLTGFAYGNPWSWAEQQYEWAYTLHDQLGEAADTLDGAHVLSLLARHPRAAAAGTGRTVLQTWLDGIQPSACWLQTSDMESPATRLYRAQGFTPIGHGPNAPNGKPGLVLFRDAGTR